MSRKKKQRSKKHTAGSSSRSSLLLGWIAGAVVVAVVLLALQLSGGGNDEEQTVMEPVQGTPTAAPVPSAPPPPPMFSELAVAETDRISAEETKRLIDSGDAVLIDVRDVESYKAGHIPGALQIPLAYVQGEIPWFPTDKKLITYCT